MRPSKLIINLDNLASNDGYTRRLSNKEEVLIRGQRYNIAGTVCMDQLMIDLAPDVTAYNGDQVTLVGTDGGESISIEDMADWIGSETLEIVTGFNTRLPSEYA